MARLKGFQKLTSADVALHEWLNVLQVDAYKQTSILLQNALNRVLAEDIIAKEDLPRFDKSAVDGYAVRAEDTKGASQFKPIVLQLTDSDNINQGRAKQIWTGNPIPTGANAVVMLENTQKRERGNQIEIWTQMAPGDNISRKGEDIKKNEVAIKKGTKLNPYHIGLLAALGVNQVKVIEKLKIAIITTGNELVDIGSRLTENQIYDSNRCMLAAMCQELNTEPIDMGTTRDDLSEIMRKLEIAIRSADAIITTGGTSVGAPDLVPEAINRIGKPGVIVHGIAIRPAMPTALAILENKPILVLSGNPVAAVVGFELFARPMICKISGMAQVEQRPRIQATLTRKVTTALGRKNFVRVKVAQKNNEYVAEPISARGSGMITTMTKANGYVIVPENTEGIAQGETVIVHLFSEIEKDE